MSHTPGEWWPDQTVDVEHMRTCLAEGKDTPRAWIAVESLDDDQGGHVAYCHPDNADLIAASPRLLEALEALVNDADDTGCDGCAVVGKSALKKAERVIRDAKGEITT